MEMSDIISYVHEFVRVVGPELGGPTWWHVYLAIFALAGAFVLRTFGRTRFLLFGVVCIIFIATVDMVSMHFVYREYYPSLEDAFWVTDFLAFVMISIIGLGILAIPMLLLEWIGAGTKSIAVVALVTAVLVWVTLPFAGEIIMCTVAGDCIH